MALTGLTRRERHRSSTRAALQEAALSLTEKSGLAAVTVDAITQRADVALRTFANYFPSKEDAVLGHDPADWTASAETLLAHPIKDNTWTALRAALIANTPECVGPLELRQRRAAVLRAEPRLRACSAAHSDRVAQELIRAVGAREGTDSGTDLASIVMVHSALSACRAAVLWWSAVDPQPSLEDALGQALDLAAGQYRTAVPPQLARGKRAS